MYLHGSFYDIQGREVAVEIVTGGSRSPEREVGSGGLYFDAASPVEIESGANDTRDTLLPRRATVRLLTAEYLPDLFSPGARHGVVNIRRGSELLFAGYVEPGTYSQEFQSRLDLIEVNCVDCLAALQYFRYKGAGEAGTDYAALRRDAGQVTLSRLILDILGGVARGTDLSDEAAEPQVWHDGSKQTASEYPRGDGRKWALDYTSVSELLMLGSDEDEAWTQADALAAALRYLGLHIEQHGAEFRIFSWRTVKAAQTVTWRRLGGTETRAEEPGEVEITTDIAADTDTRISVGEVYSRVSVTCKTEDVDSVVESPLDSGLLQSPYGGKQKYITEYSSDGDGETAATAFYNITHGGRTDYDRAYVRDWYLQARTARGWTFRNPVPADPDRYLQHSVANGLLTLIGAGIFSFGKIDHSVDLSDDSPTARVDMTDRLVVSVNGNGLDRAESGTRYPVPTEDGLLAAAPVAEYAGGVSGGVFSPSDEASSHYIVISGSVTLCPLTPRSGDFADIAALTDPAALLAHEYVGKRRYPCQDYKDDGSRRYYTYHGWQAASPTSAPSMGNYLPLMPDTGDGWAQYPYNYSAVGDSTDRMSKVPVLQCMLVIGDKCAVEAEGSEGLVSDITWQPYKERAQCADDAEYYAQSFSIGFNPKIGDRLIGKSHPLQNNITHEMGLDTEGTAIRIRRDDRLSGRVRFMILGPVNTVWDDITRRHPSFWRHTRWTSTTVPLLAHVASIQLSKFEVRVCGDTAEDGDGDGDIVYVSATDETYVNTCECDELTLHSALTAEECKRLGAADRVMLSTALDGTTGVGLLSIHDALTGETGRPEQMLVDEIYGEYHAPRVLLTQRVTDRAARRWARYTHPAMPGRGFFVQDMSHDLRLCEATLHLKETDTE